MSLDEVYFREKIAPLLSDGEIDERSKTEFLGQAQALLFPIDWPEPFGLVMIEAMACGTPVLAFRQGSVSEIIPTTGIACCCARAASGHARTAEQRDEFSPVHSITSSALASSVGGTIRPSALAVVRLTARSNLVGAVSAGLATRRRHIDLPE